MTVIRPGSYETTIRGAPARLDRHLDLGLRLVVERAFAAAGVMPADVAEVDVRVGEDVDRWVVVLEVIRRDGDVPLAVLPVVVELDRVPPIGWLTPRDETS